MIYVFCLIWMAKESLNKTGLEVKRDLILGRLTSNGWTDMGFDSAKEVLGESCSDEEIHRVIQSFPKVLRNVRLRVRDSDGNIQKKDGKTLYKAGVGLVKVENI
jgi:hypothetical protein